MTTGWFCRVKALRAGAREIALTLQARRSTTLRHLNASTISKETGDVSHHSRGARWGAPSCLALVGEGEMRCRGRASQQWDKAFIKAQIEGDHQKLTTSGELFNSGNATGKNEWAN
jgi:hypothetical protein